MKIFRAFQKLRWYIMSKKQQLKFFKLDYLDEFKDISRNKKLIVIDNPIDYNLFKKNYNYSHLSNELCRFLNGSVFYALVQFNNCLSSGWSIDKGVFWISEINVELDLSFSNRIILYDFFTEPEFRGEGFYSQLLKNIINYNPAYAEFIIYILPSNLSSENGLMKAGFIYDGVYNQSNFKKWCINKNCIYLGNKYKLFGLFSKNYEVKNDENK